MSFTTAVTHLLVYHLASGQAFFSGAALILAAVACWPRPGRNWLGRIRVWLVVLGVILVVLSATPFPRTIYVALAVITLAWIVAEWSAGFSTRGRRAARACAAVAWVAVVCAELPYHWTPAVPRIAKPVLGVIADSLTAGLGDNDTATWPRILAEQRQVVVRDHAVMGATVASARKQAAELAADETLVLLEIGGNDLLGTTTSGEFERGLETLLDKVCQPGRTAVMFELPLLPIWQSYGLVQRRAARSHEVLLIPKRVLLRILQNDATTLDSIHLTTEGHQRMADAVWGVVHPAFDAD
jgi:acyl-CoA thioesterase-1